MKKTVLLSFLFALLSCGNFSSSINIEIANNSKEVIKNIKFATSENKEVLTFEELKPGEKIKEVLAMDKNKQDGHYTLQFTDKNGNIKQINSGYYSNGKPLDSEIIVSVEKDTTLIKTN